MKTLLQQRGYVFESDTDTEVIAKLIHHLWVQHPGYSFRELVEQVVQQLVGIPFTNDVFAEIMRGMKVILTNSIKRTSETIGIVQGCCILNMSQTLPVQITFWEIVLGGSFRALLQEQVLSGRVRGHEAGFAASRWYQDQDETGDGSRTYPVRKR